MSATKADQAHDKPPVSPRVPDIEERLFSMRQNAALLALLSLGQGHTESVLFSDEQGDAWYRIGELCSEMRDHLRAVEKALQDGKALGRPAPNVERER